MFINRVFLIETPTVDKIYRGNYDSRTKTWKIHLLMDSRSFNGSELKVFQIPMFEMFENLFSISYGILIISIRKIWRNIFISIIFNWIPIQTRKNAFQIEHFWANILIAYEDLLSIHLINFRKRIFYSVITNSWHV